MISVVLQILICVTGPLAVWLVGKTDHKISKWGYVVGLVSQVFWAALFITDHQYIMLLVDVIYTWVWLIGFRNNWRKCSRCHKSRPMFGTGHICVDCIDTLFGRPDEN